GAHIAKEGQAHLLGPFLGKFLQPIIIDDEQIIDEEGVFQPPRLSHPVDFVNNGVYGTLAAPLLAFINLIIGVVETVGALIGAAARSHKALDWRGAAVFVLAIHQLTVGMRQIAEAAYKRAHIVLDNLAVNLEPPVGNIGL